MSFKKVTFLLVFTIFMVDIIAQLPPKTVVFKVRKNSLPVISGDLGEVIMDSKEEGVWFVEENATFQGGNLTTFSSWIAKQIQYPAEASEAGIAGKVIVQFSIGRDGKVINAKVIRGVHPSIDKEAVRVIMSSPKWQPAKQSGNPVKQNYVVPIVFSIQ